MEAEDLRAELTQWLSMVDKYAPNAGPKVNPIENAIQIIAFNNYNIFINQIKSNLI